MSSVSSRATSSVRSEPAGTDASPGRRSGLALVPGAGGLAPIVASTPSQLRAMPRSPGTPATSAWNAPSRIRAVCSARVRSRPSQNSSWAIRASIRRGLLLLLLLLGLVVPAAVADVGQPRRAVERAAFPGARSAWLVVVEHPGVLGAAALRGVDDHRALPQRHPGQPAGDDPDLLAEHRERPQVDVARRQPPAAGLGRRGRQVDELLGDERLRLVLRSSAPGARSSAALAWGPMNTPLPPDSEVGLMTSSCQAAQHVLALRPRR